MGWHNRSPRIRLQVPATIVTSDRHECAATVADVSADGFRLEGAQDLYCGEQILIRVGKAQPVTATVRWVRGSEVGGTFNERPELDR